MLLKMEKIKKQDLHLTFQQIKNGDSDKINVLYSKYNRLVYGIAFSILKNKEDSEDIIQIGVKIDFGHESVEMI